MNMKRWAQAVLLAAISLLNSVGCRSSVTPEGDQALSQCGWHDAYGIEYCYVSGGAFTMGDDRFPSASPPYKAEVQNFFLMKYEMTEAHWADILTAGLATSRSSMLPLVNVSRSEVNAVLKAYSSSTGLEHRLPDEIEWEYAARAGSSAKYPWGDSYDGRRAHFVIGGGGERMRVGSFPPNSFGLHDMIGNVAEMTAGDYSHYPIGDQPIMPGWFAFRGDGIDGGWPHVFARGLAKDKDRHAWLGFRLALDARFKDVLKKDTQNN
jgi:formylglycine-generating enzyme required for sulfatase activity